MCTDGQEGAVSLLPPAREPQDSLLGSWAAPQFTGSVTSPRRAGTALTAFLLSSGLRELQEPSARKAFQGVPRCATCCVFVSCTFFHQSTRCLDVVYGLQLSAFLCEFSFKIRDLLLKQFSNYYSKLHLFTEENLRHKEGK